MHRLSSLVGYGLFYHDVLSLPLGIIASGPVRNEKSKRDDVSPAYPSPPAVPGGGRGPEHTCRGKVWRVASPQTDEKGPGTTLALSSTPTRLQHSINFADSEIYFANSEAEDGTKARRRSWPFKQVHHVIAAQFLFQTIAKSSLAEVGRTCAAQAMRVQAVEFRMNNGGLCSGPRPPPGTAGGEPRYPSGKYCSRGKREILDTKRNPAKRRG